jgi:integrase
VPSLQARHSRSCQVGKEWTSFADAGDGCSCKPSYYVVVRNGRKAEKTPVGKNRKLATRALVKVDKQVEEGYYRAPQNITFEKWAYTWRENLRRPKENTKDSYHATLEYGIATFGHKKVRALTTADVQDFLRQMTNSPTTQAKHLRVLQQCLDSAIAHGYASRNPVTMLPKDERPRSEKKEAAYFEAAEIPKLFQHIPAGLRYTACTLALKTGMRQGELIALRWANVDLSNEVIHVRENYTRGRLTSTKNRQARDVDLTPDAAQLLADWWRECGSPVDDAVPVFPGEGESGYLSSSTLTTKTLYVAMEAAGIPRVGPTGEKRTFHSFRHTFAKLALEHGRQMSWLSRHLGHSSIQVTDGVYGHWESAARKAEIAGMAGVFGV